MGSDRIGYCRDQMHGVVFPVVYIISGEYFVRELYRVRNLIFKALRNDIQSMFMQKQEKP